MKDNFKKQMQKNEGLQQEAPTERVHKAKFETYFFEEDKIFFPYGSYIWSDFLEKEVLKQLLESLRSKW